MSLSLESQTPIDINKIRDTSNIIYRFNTDAVDLLIKDINHKIEVAAISGRKQITYTNKDVTKLIWYRNLEFEELEELKNVYSNAGYDVKLKNKEQNSYSLIFKWRE